MIAHHASILHVNNIPENKDFFEKLGFKVTFEWGEPIDYMVMKAGNSSIHLSKAIKVHINSGQTDIYFFGSDIEKYYKQLKSAGIKELGPLVEHDSV